MSPDADTEAGRLQTGGDGPIPDSEAASLRERPRYSDVLALAGVSTAVVLASSIAVAMFLA
jgi:hypothetical protein